MGLLIIVVGTELSAAAGARPAPLAERRASSPDFHESDLDEPRAGAAARLLITVHRSARERVWNACAPQS
jgi:hypothetical protein